MLFDPVTCGRAPISLAFLGLVWYILNVRNTVLEAGFGCVLIFFNIGSETSLRLGSKL